MLSAWKTRKPALAAAILSGLLLGIVLVASVGLAAGTGRLAGESDESKALRVLRADQADLQRLTRGLAAARHLENMHAAAGTADRLVAQVRDRDTAMAVLEDEQVKTHAVRAHRATQAILTSFAELANVSEEDLDAWDDAERDAISALGELDAAAAPVAAMEPERPLRLDSRPVEALVEDTSEYLTTSAAKLAIYERRMVKFRRKNRGRIQEAADYRATVLAQVASYQATRKQLQEYFEDARQFGELIVDFRNSLQDAKSKRQGIRGTMASTKPPGSVQSEHMAMIAVLDHSITATDLGVDLADAIERRREMFDYETDAFDLPEYERFVEQSGQITSERDAAVASWTKSLDTYQRRLKHPEGAPSKPTV